LYPLFDPYARIFLLSHMRAFTSLAGHILGSHPQINGYYEMHISYEDASALERQLEVFRQGDVLKAFGSTKRKSLSQRKFSLELFWTLTRTVKWPALKCSTQASGIRHRRPSDKQLDCTLSNDKPG
jgi:hypothetical protein